MSDVTLIPDNAQVKLTNMMNSPSGYKLPNGTFRRFAPNATMTVTAGEVREASNMPGAVQLFQNYIRINDKDLANELGVSEDSYDNEYSWTRENIVSSLTTQPIEVLLDALDLAPDAVKESIVDLAVELEIPDINRRKAIFEATGQDVTKMIEVKNAYKGKDEAKGEPAAAPARRASTAKKTSSTASTRRTAKKTGE